MILVKYSKIIIDELAKLDASSSNLVKPRILKWSCHSSKVKELLSMNYTKRKYNTSKFDRNNLN